MNAGILWVAFPLAAAGAVGVWPQAPTRRKRWVAVGVAALLALTALWVPIGRPLPLLGYRWTWTLAAEWHLLGRGFVLDATARPWLSALWTWAALWALLASEARLAPDFPSWSLALPAGLTLALAATDFLPTVLLLALTLVGLIFLWTPTVHRPRGVGVMRFLTAAAAGLPLLLLALTRLPSLETAPPQTPEVQHTGLLLGLGLALWAGVFPFHIVYPLLGQETYPYRLGFGGWMTHMALVLAVLHWAPSVAWLRDNPVLYDSLRILGFGTIGLAGALLLVQQDFGRVVGYSMWLSTGWSWLALAQGLENGALAFLTLAWPRALLWLGWTWAVSVLGLPDARFTARHLASRGRAAPWLAAVAVLGLGAWAPWPGLSLGGLVSAIVLPPALTPWEWLLLAMAFVGTTWAAIRWARILYLAPHEPEPNLPESLRERAWVVVVVATWVMVAFLPGLWYAWAAAARGWLP